MQYLKYFTQVWLKGQLIARIARRQSISVKELFLIHEADPQSQPLGIIVFYTCPFVRLLVRPHFLKQNKFQAKRMFATGESVGLADWIIDDTCLVFLRLATWKFTARE